MPLGLATTSSNYREHGRPQRTGLGFAGACDYPSIELSRRRERAAVGALRRLAERSIAQFVWFWGGDATAMTTVAIALICAAIIGLLILAVVRRLGRSEDNPADLVPSTSEDAGIGADDLVLVPLPNGRQQALVLGAEDALDVLDASGLVDRDATRGPGQVPQLVRAAIGAGGGHVTAQAQHGIDSGRIVALSEETMRHLEAGKPVYDKAQNMLGVIKGDKGRFSHIMRLDQKGAQAVVASNAATLAMTAAVNQQLAAIEEKLAEISDTLNQMVREKDAERLADIVAANKVLLSIAEDIRRRGVTDKDMARLANLDLPVTANQLEAEFKFQDMLEGDLDKLSRSERLERLERLAENERLDYWLAVRVQADLAQTRLDLLNLQWEITKHPDTAAQITDVVRANIERRQHRLFTIGETLRELADPESRTRFDVLHQVARWRLGKEGDKIDTLLSRHGEGFVAPDEHPYAITSPGHEPRALLPATDDPADLSEDVAGG